MIVYQAATSFFAMKADAERHARAQGLKASDVVKMSIEDRDDLARALNFISQVVHADDARLADIEVAAKDEEDVPDFVPAFIRADWERRRRARSAA